MFSLAPTQESQLEVLRYPLRAPSPGRYRHPQYYHPSQLSDSRRSDGSRLVAVPRLNGPLGHGRTLAQTSKFDF
jgi:hypothetical protein